MASIAPLSFFALLRLCSSSALPAPVPRLPSLGSRPPHDAIVSLGRRVLRLWLLVPRWRHPLCRVFRPISTITSYVPGIFLPSTLLFVFVPVPASTPASIPILLIVHIPVLILVPVPVPVTVSYLPPLVPLTVLFSRRYHIVGQAPGLAPEAADYPQAPPPAYRDDAACVIAMPDLLLCSFPHATDSRALFLPPSSPFSSLLPSPSVLLPLFPFPLPSSSPSLSCVPSVVSAPFLAPTPPPPPFLSSFPSPLAPFRPSDLVPRSVQCGI